LTKDRLEAITERCGKKAAITGVRVGPHRLRDAFAVHAVKLNNSSDGLRLLQKHLGHVSFNTTAKYRKVAGEELKDWYDRRWEKEVRPGGA